MMAGARRPRIAVLLSTYNGEAHLAAQLDSLAAQEGVTVEVFARDDASSDGTLAILARYARLWPWVAPPLARPPSAGASLGPGLSFMTLLRTVPGGFDAYAFCDQDDVWLPDKLARAVQALAAADAGPALYCSRVLCVDRDLRRLGESPLHRDPRFEHLLFENIAHGNTVVMNPAARSIVRSRAPGPGMVMHDWWCALVTSALGTVVYDPAPRILYRQHRGNAVGGAAHRLGEIKAHIKVFWRDPRRLYPIHNQAVDLLRLFGDRLSPPRRMLTESLVASRRSLAERLKFAAMGPMIRNRPLDALAGRILVAADLY